jgi:membrane protein required for colicin V production
MAWPDLAIGLVAAVGVWQGWRRGLISELTGTVAFAAAIAAAFVYPGMWDGFFAALTHLGPGSSHVVAMIVFAGVAYALVFALGALLGTIAKLPVIGTANGALGGVVGLVKTTVFVWAVLYVALFFPLSRDLRDDLHHSWLVAMLEQPNAKLDGTLRSSLPWFVRPFSESLFARHRV